MTPRAQIGSAPPQQHGTCAGCGGRYVITHDGVFVRPHGSQASPCSGTRLLCVEQLPRPARRRLPDDRAAVTRTLRIVISSGEVEAYATVGLYPDGQPGEVFLRVGKEGETIRGFADAVALCMSIGLQYGVPLAAYVEKLKGLRFEPAGRTSGDDEQRTASSVLDYLAGWMYRRFINSSGRQTP